MTPYEDLPKETSPDEMARVFAIHLHTYGCNASEALAVLLGAAMNYIAMHDALEEENPDD